MRAHFIRHALAVAFALAAMPALAAPNCEALAAEAAQLEAEMAAIGGDVAAMANSRAAQRQQMAVGSMVAQGLGQFVPMGGLLSHGIDVAKKAQVQGAAAAMEKRMARMRTASMRLMEVEMMRERRCGH